MELHHSVTGFFHEAVTSALKSTQVEAGDATEFYLVNLLVEFTKAPRVDDEPLALKMAHASGAPPEERVRTLREIGDTTLYVTGFFGDSLAHKLIDADYYISMGGSAYGQLSRGGVAPQVLRDAWSELSDKFRKYVEVLNEVRASTNVTGGSNVLRLCEEWVKTGSDWLEKRLRASGVVALDKKKLSH